MSGHASEYGLVLAFKPHRNGSYATSGRLRWVFPCSNMPVGVTEDVRQRSQVERWGFPANDLPPEALSSPASGQTRACNCSRAVDGRYLATEQRPRFEKAATSILSRRVSRLKPASDW